MITSRYHLVRTETSINQCSTAKLTMVGNDPELSPIQWLGRFVEKALRVGRCSAAASPCGKRS